MRTKNTPFATKRDFEEFSTCMAEWTRDAKTKRLNMYVNHYGQTTKVFYEVMYAGFRVGSLVDDFEEATRMYNSADIDRNI